MKRAHLINPLESTSSPSEDNVTHISVLLTRSRNDDSNFSDSSTGKIVAVFVTCTVEGL
jgi:hypothetical protein